MQPSAKPDPSADKSVFSFQKHSSNEKVSPIQGKYATKNKFVIKRKNREDDGIHSSMEKLHDSLDDQTAVDSGLGSSSEYKTKVKLF